MNDNAIYTIDDLASYSGVPKRRIRNWIYRGAVPHAYKGTTKGVCYGPEHLKSIRSVLDAQDNHVTISDLAERRGYHLKKDDWSDEKPLEDDDPADDISLDELMRTVNGLDVTETLDILDSFDDESGD